MVFFSYFLSKPYVVSYDLSSELFCCEGSDEGSQYVYDFMQS